MADVYRIRTLKPIPPGAAIVTKAGKQSARFIDAGGEQRTFPLADVAGKMITGVSTCYYGKIKEGARWRRVKLYRDKTASERRLRELQTQADHRHAGMRTPETEAIEQPIEKLQEQYIAAMKRERKKPDHVRISEYMLEQIIKLAGWRFFADIDKASMEKVIEAVEKSGGTVSYQNKYITRAKAFVHHWLPEGWPDPLKRLHRINEKDARQTRGRRAATGFQLVALLQCQEIPDHRKLAYALAGLNGMRRNEVAKLDWSRVKLNSPIPHVGIPHKQRQDNKLDYVALHPYVAKLLRERDDSRPKVLQAVPDVSTLKKDWERVVVTMTDERGERLDYHALRHTFQTLLDQTGCSRATKKRLMRHASGDVTDGYAHAELAEMSAAIARLPSPLPAANQAPAQAMTGTYDAPVSSDQHLTKARAFGRILMRGDAQAVNLSSRMSIAQNRQETPANCTGLHDDARPCLNRIASAANVVFVGPSTQVD